jgi:sugar/nucleoside kinase (ribokinase family)
MATSNEGHAGRNARQTIAGDAARELARLAGSGELARRRALVGFDGFIDSIIRVVDRRHRMDDAPGAFTPIEEMRGLGERINAAAGLSTNMELIVESQRFGGNGPLMAGGLGRLGLSVTYVGGVGTSDDPSRLHPIYEPFAARCARVIPVAAPATTDALEFADGKVMLGKPASLQGVTWDSLKARVGLDVLREAVGGSALVAIVNWVMMGGVQGIWEGLTSEVLGRGATGGGGGGGTTRVFIDLCDPAKRTDADVASALGALRRMNERAPVTLGLNLAEAVRIDAVSGAGAFAGLSSEACARGEVVREASARVRKATGLDCVVIHPRHGAAASDARGAHWFDGPLVGKPRLSTGAGDHFNAGFAMAQVAGLSLEQCLATGCATSGAYVRDAESPTIERLCELLRTMPDPEAGA